MKNKIIILIAIIGLLSITGCKEQPEQSAQVMEFDWTNIWIENDLDSDHPNLLIVGDSIVDGYYPYIKEGMTDQFDFGKYTTSKFIGDPDFLIELELILSRHSFDIIHINNGLHGLDQSIDSYREGIISVLDLLSSQSNPIKIIWCMTTPMMLREHPDQFDKLNQIVKERNQAALEIMEENGVKVYDLYGDMLNHPEYYSEDGMHFSETGRKMQGEMIISTLLEEIRTD